VRAFACDRCSLQVTFESAECLRCGAALAFDWSEREIRTFADDAPPRCANAEIAACNWLPETDGELCFSCSLTRERPHDRDAEGLEALARAEGAKRRLLFELGELGLPIDGERLRFDLLSSAFEPVTTGHADGLITIDLAEADDTHRTQMREQMGEPYRTLLGHFRHEVGHYYFDVLTADADGLEQARAVFGDEREDYQAALDRHYADGPPADWPERHVSAYATMHPSEDWAETFAHLLHIRDTLQTASAFGVRVEGAEGGPYSEWVVLSYALNEINRSMGLDDLYPFVLTAPVIEKLECVDGLISKV
jgi:hypothetical protein